MGEYELGFMWKRMKLVEGDGEGKSLLISKMEKNLTRLLFFCIGLIFTKIDPYYESVFFVAFVSFILIYMVLLIRDLDNPFGYYEKESFADEVSLKPLFDLEKRVSITLKKLS